MTSWIKTHRKRAALSAFAVMAAAAIASASLAMAQSASQPDGSTDDADAAALITTACGSQFFSTVRTENAVRTTTSTAFVTLPGAATIVNVPSGATRCIKVVFTAETACRQTPVSDVCYVRALDNGVAMQPQGGNVQAIDSEHGTPSGHGFEWVRRVGAGAHTIVIQWRVGNAATIFTIDDWTFDVQTHA